ncbi:MAG: TRAP transporter large permease subunit [Chloroflexi bacterium]|nr:TRAP transporter large permease subunit [Chloroflexota bacterium]
MDWWIVLIIVGGLLMAFFFSGMPVAFGFLSLNVIGILVWMGGIEQLRLLVPSAFASVGVFTLVVVPLFILMGEVLFQTGLVKLIIDALSKWVGRVRGSLSLIAIGAGTIFAMMSGSAVSGVAVFGSTLAPEMRTRGYRNEMIYAPLMAAGSLATMIPPSVLAVVVATLSQQSLGKLLIAGVIPGLLLAFLYAAYILGRCYIQPHLAPSFAPPKVTWGERLKGLLVIAPLAIIIFLVLGIIFLGIATPTESAALGATGSLILAAAYRRLTWQTLKKSFLGTVSVTAMVFSILISANAFSQLLAYTQVLSEMSALATSLPVPPIVIVIIMQLIMFIMGMFIDSFSMGMIAVPLFFPVIRVLGLDPLWFGLLMMVNMEAGTVSPPFGIVLFTLKGVVPDATMGDIYRAGIPVFLCIAVLLILVLLVPPLATWLPSFM